MRGELLVIVPSRDRPEAVAGLWRAFLDTAPAKADLLIAVDNDDPKISDYLAAVAEADTRRFQIRVGERLRLGGTLNETALEYADIYYSLAFMGDDHRPRTHGWDEKYIEALEDHLFVYGDDLLQRENLPTQVAMRSEVITTLGYMSPPTLVHMFIDDAWKAWGNGTRIKYLPDVVVEHLHPAAGKAQQDALYAEVWAHMEPDSLRWQEYNSSGQLAADIDKLRGLLRD